MPRPLAPPRPGPLTLPGARGTALCVHGFTATPFEVQGVAEALSAAGIGARAVLLPGHGTHPDALNHVTADGWQAHVDEAFAALPTDRPRFVVGSSMGAALAILLAAARSDDIAGLVLLAPAIFLHESGRFGAALARAGLGQVLSSVPKAERGGDMFAEDGRALNDAYNELPVDGVAAFEQVRLAAGAVLSQLRCPLLVFHGAHDRTIDPRSSGRVARRAQSPYIERHRLPHSRHILGLDEDRDLVIARTVAFCVERAAPAAAPVRP